MSKFSTLLVASLVALLLGTQAHVRMNLPASRSSLWRFDKYLHLDPPVNYDDDGLYCGREHQWPEVTTCGLCGDPFVDPTPRANEHEGTYGKGIISEVYSSGQVLDFNKSQPT